MGDVKLVDQRDWNARISFIHDILPTVVYYSIFGDRDVLSVACTCKSAKKVVKGCAVHLRVKHADPKLAHYEMVENPLPHSLRLFDARLVSVVLQFYHYAPPVQSVLDRCSETLKDVEIVELYVMLNGSSIVPVLPLMPKLEKLKIRRLTEDSEVSIEKPYDLSHCISRNIVSVSIACGQVSLPFISDKIDIVRGFRDLHTLVLVRCTVEFLHLLNLPPNLRKLVFRDVCSTCEHYYGRRPVVWPSKLQVLTLHQLHLPFLDDSTIPFSSLPSTLKKFNVDQSLRFSEMSFKSGWSELKHLELYSRDLESLEIPENVEGLFVSRCNIRKGIEFFGNVLTHLSLTNVEGSLTQLTIPLSVVKLEIYHCVKLKDITATGTRLETLGLRKIAGARRLVVPDGVKHATLSELESTEEIRLPKSVKSGSIKGNPLLTRIDTEYSDVRSSALHELRLPFLDDSTIPFSSLPSTLKKSNVDQSLRFSEMDFKSGWSKLKKLELYDRNLESLEVPENVEGLVVIGCNLRTKLTFFGNVLTYLRLREVEGLTHITIPHSVVAVEIGHCVKLQDITATGTRIEALSLKSIAGPSRLVVPDGVKHVTLSELESTEEIRLPKSVKSGSIKGNPLLTRIDTEYSDVRSSALHELRLPFLDDSTIPFSSLPSTLKKSNVDQSLRFSEMAFKSGWSKLKKFELYDRNLESLEVPENVEGLVVIGCNLRTKLTFFGNVLTYLRLREVEGLTHITIPHSVVAVEIGHCVKLQDVTISGCTRLETLSLKRIAGPTRLVVPDGVKSVEVLILKSTKEICLPRSVEECSITGNPLLTRIDSEYRDVRSSASDIWIGLRKVEEIPWPKGKEQNLQIHEEEEEIVCDSD